MRLETSFAAKPARTFGTHVRFAAFVANHMLPQIAGIVERLTAQ